MNKEIKEIIDLINEKYKDYYLDDFLSGEDIKNLVDHITNLENLYKEMLDNYENLILKYSDLQHENELLKIKTIKTIFYINDNLDTKKHKKLLNILQGEKDD